MPAFTRELVPVLGRFLLGKSNLGLLLHIADVGPAHRRPGADAAPAGPAASNGGRAGRQEGPQPADPPGGRHGDGGRDLRAGRAVELRGPVRLGVLVRRGDHRGVRDGRRQQGLEPQVEAGRATGGGTAGRLQVRRACPQYVADPVSLHGGNGMDLHDRVPFDAIDSLRSYISQIRQ